MLSALLIGYNVEVPEGRLVGGSLPDARRSAPAPGQTGCVVTYMSFRADSPPPTGALFGRAAAPGHDRRLHQPGRARRGGSAPLDSYWFAGAEQLRRPAITWSSTGPPPAPFLHTAGPGLRRMRPSTARPAISRSRSTPIPTTRAPTRFRATSTFGPAARARLGPPPRRHQPAPRATSSGWSGAARRAHAWLSAAPARRSE